MVKWLSCLPSKQAARVRFPFGVMIFSRPPPHFCLARVVAESFNYFSRLIFDYEAASLQASSNFIESTYSVRIIRGLRYFPEPFENLSMHVLSPNCWPQINPGFSLCKVYYSLLLFG